MRDPWLGLLVFVVSSVVMLPAVVPPIGPAAGEAPLSILATIPLPHNPFVAVPNPNTNKIYVTYVDFRPDISVIDGATNRITTTIEWGERTMGAAVNPTTNRIYVATWTGEIPVLDGATDTLATTIFRSAEFEVSRLIGLDLNPSTNRVYAGALTFGLLFVIDGAANRYDAVVPLADGATRGVAVNPVTNRVYVAHALADTVTILDGATNTVIGTVPVGDNPFGLGVNPHTNRIYVTNHLSGTVSVIDGATNRVIAIIPGLEQPYFVDVNPETNYVYVGNYGARTLSVIDGTTHQIVGTVPLPAGGKPLGVRVNPATNRVYVALGEYLYGPAVVPKGFVVVVQGAERTAPSGLADSLLVGVGIGAAVIATGVVLWRRRALHVRAQNGLASP